MSKGTEQETPRDSGHIRALDGIRGAAVLCVFIYHALAYSLVEPTGALLVLRKVAACGWIGVDIFFVLSGFLITTILLDARRAENYFSVFYARRALRIAPLYYLVLVTALLLGGGHYSFRAQLPYWLNLSNLVTAFVPAVAYLGHFWSLAIEEQFYLVWPAVVRRLRVRHLAFVCVTIIIAATIARNLPAVLAMNARLPEFVYRFTPFRLDGLCGGALLAMVVKYRPQWLANRLLLRTVLIVSFAIFAATKGYYRSTAVVRFGFTAVMLGACALVTLALYPHGLTSRIFSSAFLRRWGKYSYSAYLLHFFLISYVADELVRFRQRLPFHASLNEATLFVLPWELVLVFAASACSWHFFEGPILKAKRHFRYSPRPEHYLA